MSTIQPPCLLAAVDDTDQPEGRIAIHRRGVAAQLQAQVLAGVGEQRIVTRDIEHLSGIGLEAEYRVVHGLGVHRSDSDDLLADVPVSGRHCPPDDAGIRLSDVLHVRRALELCGSIDSFGDLDRGGCAGGRGAGKQDTADHHSGEQQHRSADPVCRDPGLATVVVG